jgi:hypothetical protein
MASLAVLLPATDADAIYRRLTAAARLLPAEDPRSPDQQRADLLVDAVLTGLPVDALPQAQGRKPGINLHASLSTVAGLDDEPGYLDGYGPITAQELRRLAFAADATWRRMVTDPVSGQILDYGRTTYRPPQPLIDLTIARAQVCAFPGCHQPGHHCDIDHIVPYGEQGETCPANTAPLCRRHHRCKTRGPFRYRLNRDGSHSWQLGRAHTPADRRYALAPTITRPGNRKSPLRKSSTTQDATQPKTPATLLPSRRSGGISTWLLPRKTPTGNKPPAPRSQRSSGNAPANSPDADNRAGATRQRCPMISRSNRRSSPPGVGWLSSRR